MPAKQRRSYASMLAALLEQYAEARIADAEKGGGDPASYEEIELNLVKARLALRDYLIVTLRACEDRAVREELIALLLEMTQFPSA